MLSSMCRAAKKFVENNMLKALLLYLTNLVLAVMATAQNLVPNPSFEDTTYCIGWPPPKVEALHWYTANTATPDIWNCDLVNPCGANLMDPDDGGIQIQGFKAAFDGDRYAAGYNWGGNGGSTGSNTRDYLTAKLLQPLELNQRYRVTMWCARPSGINGAIDHIGVYFSPDSIHEQYPTTLPFTPQVRLRDPNSIYIENTDWVQLVDTFTATGDERWIIFGTFEDGGVVDGIWLGWGSFPPRAYYYVDLLSVVAVEPQSVPSLVGDASALSSDGSMIRWSGSIDLESLELFDSAGRLVKRDKVPIGQRQFSVPTGLPRGIYLAKGLAGGGQYVIRFVR